VLQTCPMAHCGKQFSTTGNLTRHLKQQHHELSVSDSEDSLVFQYNNYHHYQQVLSPCDGDTGIMSTQSFAAGRSVQLDVSRGFSPLVSEISDVKDEELLETLQCLFQKQ
jgi:hypothetical protein